MVTTVKLLYTDVTTITIDVSSLASSSTFTAGRESNSISNSGNLYIDIVLMGGFTIGTSPTANTQIRVFVFGDLNDVGTFPDVLDGTDSDETLSSAGTARGFLKLVAALDIDTTTTGRVYQFGPVAIGHLFGGVLPRNWGVFVAHNSGVAFNGVAANHGINYRGIHYQLV